MNLSFSKKSPINIMNDATTLAIKNFIKQEIAVSMQKLKSELLQELGKNNNQQLILAQEKKITNSVLTIITPKLSQLEKRVDNALIDGEEIVTEYRKKQFHPGAKVGDTYF